MISQRDRWYLAYRTARLSGRYGPSAATAAFAALPREFRGSPQARRGYWPRQYCGPDCYSGRFGLWSDLSETEREFRLSHMYNHLKNAVSLRGLYGYGVPR